MNIQSGIGRLNNRVEPIAPAFIPEIWPGVRQFIIDALECSADDISLEEVYHRLACGMFQLWLVHQEDKLIAAFVTELVLSYGKRVCHIWLLGGTGMPSWLSDAQNAVEVWARSEHCLKLQAHGRLGWKSFYKSQGWNMDYVSFSKSLKTNLH